MIELGERVSVYQPEQRGLEFPREPVFDNPADERLHRKQRLAAACRAFAQHGLDYGFAGHLTVRDPEHPGL
ncbi:MAG: class II aldolase/adducin family protein, partial [Gammaproteobacteria bacterium]|nr:class II aldolase/adducin family protein [Gammaproteobacteria bacterium]